MNLALSPQRSHVSKREQQHPLALVMVLDMVKFLKKNCSWGLHKLHDTHYELQDDLIKHHWQLKEENYCEGCTHEYLYFIILVLELMVLV